MQSPVVFTRTKEDTDYAGFKFERRPNLLAIIGRWIITTITLFRGSPHSPLTYGIFGELSPPCCPLQSIFPPSAVQTLATLFGNN